MPQFRVNKLVRDKILGLMKAEGKALEMRVLTGRELQKELLTKLKEEVDEALDALDEPQKLVVELADIKEVFEAFLACYGMQRSDVEAAQVMKREKNGGIMAGYYIETITLDKADDWLRYYEDRPLQYHQIFASSDELDKQYAAPYIEPDLYQHFKGNYYEVIGVGCHAESLEYFVIYRSLYQQGTTPAIWLRPYTTFIERVESEDGNLVPRFRRIGQ